MKEYTCISVCLSGREELEVDKVFFHPDVGWTIQFVPRYGNAYVVLTRPQLERLVDLAQAAFKDRDRSEACMKDDGAVSTATAE